MSEGIWNQTIFGLYEFFTNIIPGSVIIFTVFLVYGINVSTLNETFISEGIAVVLLVFITFVIGLVIQGLSGSIEGVINKRKYNGCFPSKCYLKDDDQTFPKYFKEKIRKQASDLFGTPIDSDEGHIFDLSYAFVLKNNLSSRAPQFLRSYSLARSMILTMIIEAGMMFVQSFMDQSYLYLLAGIGFILMIYPLYKLFNNYNEAFAKEVLKSFFLYKKTETPESKN